MATDNSRMQFQNSFVSGPSRTPVPTGKKSKSHQHADTERKSYRFRGVEFSLRLVSQGDLPSANSRSDTTPWCHSLRLRRFATSPPTGKKFKPRQHADTERKKHRFRAVKRLSPSFSIRFSMLQRNSVAEIFAFQGYAFLLFLRLYPFFLKDEAQIFSYF